MAVPLCLDFEKTPLKQAIEYFRNLSGLNMVVDTPAVEDAGISLNREITIKLSKVSLKAGIHLVLHQARLTYVVKDEVLQIIPETLARDKYFSKTFCVADLVCTGEQPHPAPMAVTVLPFSNGAPGSMVYPNPVSCPFAPPPAPPSLAPACYLREATCVLPNPLPPPVMETMHPTVPAWTLRVVCAKGQAQMEMRGGRTRIHCENMMMTVAGSPFKMCSKKKQIQIRGTGLQAVADCLMLSEAKDTIVLEGNVRLTCDKNGQHSEVVCERVVMGVADNTLEIKMAGSSTAKTREKVEISPLRPAVFCDR